MLSHPVSAASYDMVITIPFGAGIVAAFIFLLFELLVFPVVMHTTSTLASFSIIRRATNGKPVQVRSISYPLWNEGLFNRQPSHALLFLMRIICIVIPVYLETRFISRSTPITVSKLIPNAYVCRPDDQDLMVPGMSSFDLDAMTLPLEIFSRCAAVDNEGWLNAKVANVSLANGNQEIRCIRGSEQVYFRTVERLPPFVEPSVVETEYFVDKTPAYRPNLTLQVQIDERPFRELQEQPLLQEENIDTRYSQVKNVKVMDTEDMECFFWRSPVPEGAPRIMLVKTSSFVCQNVTGRVVDFYYTSIEHLTNDRNTKILERDRDIVLKQFSVSTTFKFLGSLEFKDRLWINAGHLIRRMAVPPPYTADMFEATLRNMLYTRASNVTVKVPGGEEVHSVELDDVVVIVGALEVTLVFVLGLCLTAFSRWRWNEMHKANTLEGLSYIWSQNRARWSGLVKKNSRITLRLCKRMLGGEERFVYLPEELQLSIEKGNDHGRDEDEASS